MATITRESIADLNEKITVKLEKEDYLGSFEKSLKTYARTAQIPGFRKGMVPTSVVKKMYGPGVFAQEVLQVVEKALNNYVTEHQLDIFAQPLPLESDARMLDMNNPGDYIFAFEIGLKPIVQIDYKNINLTKFTVSATAEMIDEELNRLIKRHGKLEDIEQISEDRDVMNLWISPVLADGSVDNEKGKDNSLLLSYFKESMRPLLIGKKPGDVFTSSLDEAFNDKEKEWLLKDLDLDVNQPESADKIFQWEIKRVARTVDAELNDTLYEAAYPGRGISNEEEFRNAIKIEIEKTYSDYTVSQLNDQIYHHLTTETSVMLPETFLRRWIKEGGEKVLSDEEAEKQLPSFLTGLKWNLISSQLITHFGIEVKSEDIKARAAGRLMGYMGMQTLEDAPWIEQYTERMMKDKKFVENTYYELQIEKMFAAIVAEANISDSSITAEEMISKMNAQQQNR
jgi:trigger factor